MSLSAKEPAPQKKTDLPSQPKFVRYSWVAAALVLVVVSIVLGVRWSALHQQEVQRQKDQKLAQARIDSERIKADAEAQKAKAEAEVARLKAQEEAAKADAEKQLAAETAKQKAEESARTEAERKAQIRSNPQVLALWEETNHDAIRVVSLRKVDGTFEYNSNRIVAKYGDLPDWLMTMATAKYREDGENKGQIREVNGTIYDLRDSPAGWIVLPRAEVIQIVDDGYLLVDVRFYQNPYLPIRVYKLLHNGMTRILNTGDVVQMSAMSVGTFTYINKKYDVDTVPVYDPGMPIGPLKDRVISMNGKPARVAGKSKPKTGAGAEPIASGSGFFISENGLFITNAHVVEDGTRIEVKTIAGTKHATVLRVDKDKDLALLKIQDVKGTITPLTISTNAVSLGMQVFTIGYPMVDVQGSRPKFTDGKISSLAGIRDDPDCMQISVPVQPGNSGGPLADVNGDIVGVIVARLNDITIMETVGTVPQNVNYAVKGTTLNRFLSENKNLVQNAKLTSSAKRSPEDAIHLVENASGLVLIYD